MSSKSQLRRGREEGVRGNVVGAGGIGVAVGGSGVEVLRNLCDGWQELK